MELNNRKSEKLIAKFKPHIKRRGGIFTTKTRERLLGIRGQAGRDRTKYDFWYDMRNYVKTALVDLQLFIEVADRGNLHQVITYETLKPLVETLLWHPVVDHAEPDLKRAEIAQLFIQAGFNYLRSMKGITLSHGRTIEEAVDLSRYLVESFKPESERRYTPPTE